MRVDGDYISREAVKELFDGIYDCADLVFEPDDQICAKQHSSCGSCRWLETKRAIQKRVMSIHAADVRPRWIPVSEKLPEKMQYVLVRYQNNDMAVASWFGGDEHITFWRAMTDEGWCADCDTEPTHWMPLPEPPEEE